MSLFLASTASLDHPKQLSRRQADCRLSQVMSPTRYHCALKDIEDGFSAQELHSGLRHWWQASAALRWTSWVASLLRGAAPRLTALAVERTLEGGCYKRRRHWLLHRRKGAAARLTAQHWLHTLRTTSRACTSTGIGTSAADSRISWKGVAHLLPLRARHVQRGGCERAACVGPLQHGGRSGS